MNSQKKQEELKYARLFLNELNHLNRWDYRPVPNNDESFHDPEVDVYAKSERLEELRLQVKIIDRDYRKNSASRAKEAEGNVDGISSVNTRDLDPISWAKREIIKCHKKYEPYVVNNMVLLLCVYHATKMDTEFAEREFMEYRQSDFKGIYFINPSLNDQTRLEQLIPIKPLYLK